VPNKEKMKNVAAFVAGIMLFAFLLFAGNYISTTITPVQISEVKQVFLILASIGTSTGHYLGKSIRKRGKRLTYLLLGLFISLSLAAIANYKYSIQTGTLLTSGILLFLLHVSDLVVENESIEKWINIISELGSGTVLIFVVSAYYVIPLLVFVLGF